MRLVMLGITHGTASVELRGRLSLDSPSISRIYERLRDERAVDEAMVLSTCNRTELYAVLDRAEDRDLLLETLCSATGVPPREVGPHLQSRTDDRVTAHLFRVVCGLDSMILGETQIAGQVREAYRGAVAARASGKVLDGLLHRAFRVGKAVRSRTGVSAGHTSVAGAACDLAVKILGGLGGRTVLLVGAGETGERVVRHVLDAGVGQLLIANRTHARAVELARDLGGDAVPFDELGGALRRADVLITSTAAPRPFVDAALLRPALARRPDPLFIIDIAVPRNVSPDVDAIEEVYRYDMDALSAVVAANLADRGEAEAGAQAIIDAEVEKFAGWRRQQAVNPTIVQLREQFEATRLAEIEKLRSSLSPEVFRQVDRATRVLVNRLLHLPTVQIKQAAREPESEPLVQTFRLLLGLETSDAA